MNAQTIKQELQKLGNREKAKILSGFFKTGKGEYGQGDIFLGVTVPLQREIAKRGVELSLPEIEKLLKSPIHECRLTALLILTYQYLKATEKEKKHIFDFYVLHTDYINNWDLVDVSTPNIVGTYLLDKNRKILYTFAHSKNLWERRISILATFAFLRQKDFSDTCAIANLLLNDSHDLIHKAVGWMLRELGKRDEKVLCQFLDIHADVMPRTMLRYAIERFPETKRKRYLSGLQKARKGGR